MKHPNYPEIGKRFRRTSNWSDDLPLTFPEEKADLFNLSFTSGNAHYLLGQDSYRCEEHGLTFPQEPTVQQPGDARISENIHFRYPLLREISGNGKRKKHNRCLIILHGLNEHSFTRYLPWVYQIWAASGVPVILFPQTFHINRVLPEWGRHQQETFNLRKARPGNEDVHRFNAVISERLESHPERFFWGAMQTYHDLLDLVRLIRSGRHQHFTSDARVDLFGFSAGGYLALNLLLENEEDLFAESRGILFSSCCVLRNTHFSSPYIVDFSAEVSLLKMYVKNREKLTNARLLHWLNHHSECRWLDAFCGITPNRTLLESGIRSIAPRLLALLNINDDVMPAAEMLNVFQGVHRDIGVRAVELDLGIHENPFTSPDYKQSERTIVLDVLNEELYGREFIRFIESIAEHIV